MWHVTIAQSAATALATLCIVLDRLFGIPLEALLYRSVLFVGRLDHQIAGKWGLKSVNVSFTRSKLLCSLSRRTKVAFERISEKPGLRPDRVVSLETSPSL